MAHNKNIFNGLLGRPRALSDDRERTPVLLELYQQYLDNQDTSDFLREVSRFYLVGSLQRLLLNHPTREVRRAAALAIGFLGDYDSNHPMGRALCDEDRTVRTIAENGIRCLWARMGGEAHRVEMQSIIRHNVAQQYDDSVRRAGALLNQAPWFAEAWYQRGLAQFHLGRFAESIRDCHQSLEINPYHFPAATTMGQAYLELGNQVSALESFRRALKLNPGLEGVRLQVTRLERLVEDR
jgi:tetratricopeptide (TPR) repeat protein